MRIRKIRAALLPIRARTRAKTVLFRLWCHSVGTSYILCFRRRTNTDERIRGILSRADEVSSETLLIEIEESYFFLLLLFGTLFYHATDTNATETAIELQISSECDIIVDGIRSHKMRKGGSFREQIRI